MENVSEPGSNAADEPRRPDPEPPDAAPHEVEVRVRRGVRVSRFLVIGLVVGAVAAFVLTYAFPETEGYTDAQVLGFLLVMLAPIGAGMFGLVAVILDAILERRARRARLVRDEPERPR